MRFRCCAVVAILALLSQSPALAEPDLAAGQIWSYQTRPSEESSKVTVLKIESDEKLGGIIHIRVDGLQLKNPAVASGVGEVIQHLPYSETALRKSLLRLSGSVEPLPAFDEGYRTWRSALDRGEAGVFTVPVSEAVSFVEQTLNAQ